jgi:hypothetical protein
MKKNIPLIILFFLLFTLNNCIYSQCTIEAGVDVSICQGSNISLTVTGSDTYSWSPAVTFVDNSGATVLVSPLETTTYFVTGVDSLGCTVADSLVVFVNPLPVVNAGSNVNICAGAVATLIATGAQEYNWTPSTDLNTAFGDTVLASPNLTTTIYTVTGTSVFGCTGTDQVNVVVENFNPVDISYDDDTLCYGVGAVLYASFAYTYTWEPPVDIILGSQSEKVFVNPLSTETYVVTGTTYSGCVGLDSVTLYIENEVSVDAGLDISMCPGTSTSISASGAMNYTWTPTVTALDSLGTTVVVSPISTVEYVVTGTAANGCTDTDTILVSVGASINAGPDTTICSGTSASLEVTGGMNYNWTPSVTSIDSSGAAVFVNPISSTTYIVTATTANGCTGSDTVIVTVNSGNSINTGLDTSICIGTTASLSATGGLSYTWAPSVTESDSSGTTVLVSPTFNTIYVVTGTNAFGCEGTDSILVTINNVIPIILAPDTSICLGTSASLSAMGGLSYSWAPSVTESDSTGASVVVSPISSTTYVVTGTNVYGCTGSDTILVTVNPEVSINAGPDKSICLGTSALITAIGAESYTWSPNIGLNTTFGDSVFTNPTITITYVVTGGSANGCTGTDSVNVIVNNNPIISAGSDIFICLGESTILNASGAVNYSWDNGLGLGNGFLINPIVSTTYIATGMDSLECSAVDSVIVNVVNYLPPTITTSASDSFQCNGTGIVSTDPSGSFDLTWSNGEQGPSVNNLCSGPVLVLATDANYGCVFQQYGFVEEVGSTFPLSIQLSVQDLTSDGVCDGSAQFYAYGGSSPYSFALYNSSNIQIGTNSSYDGMCSGLYTLAYSDAAGSIDTLTFYVADPSNIFVVNSNLDSTVIDTLFTSLIEDCVIDFTSIDSVWIAQISYINSDTASVSWVVRDINGEHYFDQNYSITNLNGLFYLELTLFCSGKSLGSPFLKLLHSIYINAQSSLDISDLAHPKVYVYPNPSNEDVYINHNNFKIKSLKLYDLQGNKLPLEIFELGEELKIKLPDENGLYFLEVKTHNDLIIDRLRIIKVN